MTYVSSTTVQTQNGLNVPQSSINNQIIQVQVVTSGALTPFNMTSMSFNTAGSTLPSDIANAIFDGTDAVMLSAETASGEYPIEAVSMMSRIVKEAESHFQEWGSRQDGRAGLGESDAASMARAANALAKDPEVRAVAVFTMQGRSAWLMSKAKPSKRILAFTPELETCNQLAFLWGVQPYLANYANTMDDMIAEVDAALLQSGIQSGQQVVLICGYPVGAQCPPNMALLHTVGADATVHLARKLAEGNVKK